MSLASSSSSGPPSRKSADKTRSPRAHAAPSASIDLTSPSTSRPAPPNSSHERVRAAPQKPSSSRAPTRTSAAVAASSPTSNANVRSSQAPASVASSGAASMSPSSRAHLQNSSTSGSNNKRPGVASSRAPSERRPAAAGAPSASSSNADGVSRIERRMNGISLSGSQANRVSQAPKRKREAEGLSNGALANGARQNHAVSNSQVGCAPKELFLFRRIGDDLTNGVSFEEGKLFVFAEMAMSSRMVLVLIRETIKISCHRYARDEQLVQCKLTCRSPGPPRCAGWEALRVSARGSLRTNL